jgi:hypothetical protein
MSVLGKAFGCFSYLFICKKQKTEDPIEMNSVMWWIPNLWKAYICPTSLDPVPVSFCLGKSCLPFLPTGLVPNLPLWICKWNRWVLHTTCLPGNVTQQSSWADCTPAQTKLNNIDSEYNSSLSAGAEGNAEPTSKSEGGVRSQPSRAGSWWITELISWDCG